MNVRIAPILVLAALAGPRTAQEIEKLVPSDGFPDDAFGSAVAVEGERALIGSPSGVYVFDAITSGAVETTKLVPDEPVITGAVALLGDTAFVGAAGYAGQTGAVFVFQDGPLGWRQTDKLQSAGAPGGASFGGAIDVRARLAVIGAGAEDHSGLVNAGAAYVFERTPAGWVEVARLAADDAGAGDQFGVAVAVAGESVVVGAFSHDGVAADAGAAYVFDETSDGAWTQTAKLLASDGQAGDRFGRSLDATERQVVVGSVMAHTYAFARTPGGWSETTRLKPLDSPGGIGWSVAVSDARAVVGVPTALGDSGAGYLFEQRPCGWFPSSKLVASPPPVSDQMGYAVAISGDVVVLGAPHFPDTPPTGFFPGAAYVFSVAGGEPVSLAGSPPTASLSMPSTPHVLTLDACEGHAGKVYLVLGSATGTSPGVPVGDFVLPLVPDPYFFWTVEHPDSPVLSDSLGFLDDEGDGTTVFQLPVGLPPSLIGLVLHHAYAVIDLPGTGDFVHASNPVALAIVP